MPAPLEKNGRRIFRRKEGRKDGREELLEQK
jgi:hypothetical protein